MLHRQVLNFDLENRELCSNTYLNPANHNEAMATVACSREGLFAQSACTQYESKGKHELTVDYIDCLYCAYLKAHWLLAMGISCVVPHPRDAVVVIEAGA